MSIEGVDQAIASGIKPPTYEPLEVARQRQMTLANLAQAHQETAQNIQEGAIKLQQIQQAMKDTAQMRSAMDAQALKRAGAQPAQQATVPLSSVASGMPLPQSQPTDLSAIQPGATMPAQPGPAQPPSDLSAIQPGATMPAAPAQAPAGPPPQQPAAPQAPPQQQPQTQPQAQQQPALTGEAQDALDYQNTEEIANQLGGSPFAKQLRDEYLKRSKDRATASKDFGDAGVAQTKMTQANAQRLSSLAGGMVDQKSFETNIGTALHEGLITGKDAQQALAMGWNATTQAEAQNWRKIGLMPEQQSVNELAQAKDAREAALAPSQLATAKAEAATKGVLADQMTKLGMTQDQRESLDARLAEISKLNTAPELAAIASDPTKTPEQRGAANAALVRLNDYQKAGRSVTNVSAPMLTPEALEWLSKSAANGGAIPAMGRNAGAAIGQVLNRAAAISNEAGTDRNSVIAGLKANSGSLAKFQSARDQIVSFENTAKKNLDLFETQASKIPDTGVPWANTPLRLLSERMVGSENMAAVNAARAVATNEVAKVTSGGSMSGVLSDSARQEVKDYNPANATFNQTKAIVKVLRQDMANRHESMDQTLNEVKGRISGGANAPSPAGNTGGGGKSDYKVGDSVQYNGAPHTIKEIKPNGKLILAP